MISKHNNLLPALGFLRIALLITALLNMVPPLIDMLVPLTAGDDEYHLWSILTRVITPVVAPILVVVILFDYIMTRVRAADAEGPQRERFTRIGRIELAMLGLMFLFWVPYFVLKL